MFSPGLSGARMQTSARLQPAEDFGGKHALRYVAAARAEHQDHTQNEPRLSVAVCHKEEGKHGANARWRHAKEER